eukprot:gene31085-37569_t
MIWWELIVLLLPAQLGGSNIGTLLSYMLPSSVLYILAFLILVYAIKVCFLKGLAKRKLELEHVAPSTIADESVENPIPHNSGFLEISDAPISTVAAPILKEPEVAPISWPVKVLIALSS